MNVPDNDCTRCQQDIYQVHPFGWVYMEMTTPAMPNVHYVVLCATCLTDFAEFLVPELEETTEWISEKDQLLAAIREYKGKS